MITSSSSNPLGRRSLHLNMERRPVTTVDYLSLPAGSNNSTTTDVLIL
jgi:hypothetical protein